MCMHVHVRMHAHTYVPAPGMLIMLRVSCQPIDLPRGLDSARVTTCTLRLRSVDEHVVPPGLAELRAATYGVEQ